MTWKANTLNKPALFIFAITLLSSCSEIDTLEATLPESVKAGTQSQLKIVRMGNTSGDWNFADKDRFNYSFSSLPAGKFEVVLQNGKQNHYCHTTESNEVSDGKMFNEIKRDMLIKENSNGDITIAIACHKNIYRFSSADSIVALQLIVEDADSKVSDTLLFQIVR